jgi:hypothetical protein
VWVNTDEPLRMEDLRGAPVLLEFWDFCRPNSLRTLPYMRAWHERYPALHVIGVHCSGLRPSASEDAVRDAVARLGVEYPVLIDTAFELWYDYENAGWPARYLWDADGMLAYYHFGEGAYAETELAIAELLGIDECEPLAPVRPQDDPDAMLVAPTPDREEEPWSGPYGAGAVWAVLSGEGEVTVNGTALRVEHPGAYPLIEHERHTEGVLDLELGDGVRCWAVCFAPGLA